MSADANRIVRKLWSYCDVLRDDGLSYQDYLEQLTFLLFLKMADERGRLTGGRQPIPAGYRWEDLASPRMEGAELERHYRETLRVLGARGGMLGLIFEKAQNRIQDPAKLRRLIVELIGREDWSAMAADVKGDAYEGLLEKNAQDVKGARGSTSRRARSSRRSSTACGRGRASSSSIRPAGRAAFCWRRTSTCSGAPAWTATRSGISVSRRCAAWSWSPTSPGSAG